MADAYRYEKMPGLPAQVRLRQTLSLWTTPTPDAPDPATELDAGSEAPHRIDAIRTAIAQLLFNQRAAIVLRHYHELTYVEIADVLELSVSAVESLAEENAALLDLMVAANPDRDAIAARLDKLAELHRRRQQQVVEHFVRLSELLDDDQRKLYEVIGGVLARVGIGHPHPRRHHGPREDHGVPMRRRGGSVDDQGGVNYELPITSYEPGAPDVFLICNL